MITTGPIGTSDNPIEFSDNANPSQQNVIIGVASTTYQPASVYLYGQGSLTLGNIEGGTVNTPIDVTAETNLAVAAGATVDSGTSTLSLATTERRHGRRRGHALDWGGGHGHFDQPHALRHHA